jgi:hypothetical protein
VQSGMVMRESEDIGMKIKGQDDMENDRRM